MENLKNAALESRKTNIKRKPKKKRLSPEPPSQRVEIRPTPLDIQIVEEKTGVLLGQPVCTITIDKATRCIHSVLISRP